MEATHNVVLFGECGVGKSSIINTIVGQEVAKTSNDVLGCTDEYSFYSVTLGTGIKVNLWDTVGLDEGTAGKIPADRAKQNLKQFLQRQIATPDGVDLLLYCIRGGSGEKSLPIKWGHWEKYKFVFEEVCKKRIPVAMVVTCLESYDPKGDMDTWWKHNEGKISEFGFQFCAHACVTVLPRELWDADADDSRIELSRHKLQDLLSQNFLAPRNALLLGDREDREDFINMMVGPRGKGNFSPKFGSASPFSCIPVVLDTHTHVNLWNVGGFDEADDDALVTERNLKHVVRGIKHIVGVDLIFFCFRAGRVRIRHVWNYKLFHAAVCRKKVPVAIIVLGAEESAKVTAKESIKAIKGAEENTKGDTGAGAEENAKGDTRECTEQGAEECAKEGITEVIKEGTKESAKDGIEEGAKEGADSWWQRNKDALRRKGFRFDRHVYVPCDPFEHLKSGLSDTARHQLIQLVQEEHTSGNWNIGDNPFWVTVPKVQAVIGELSWPTTTVVVCDATRQGTFSSITPGVQSFLRRGVNPRQEYHFQQVGPHNFSLIINPLSGNNRPQNPARGNKSISLIMFFTDADRRDSETWMKLDKFYSDYRGDITPFVVVVCGVPEKRDAEDFWRIVPRHIRRRVGPYLTYYPGPEAGPEAQATAQAIIVDMIRDLCLVDLGEKVRILREILTMWKNYRSQRRVPSGTTK